MSSGVCLLCGHPTSTSCFFLSMLRDTSTLAPFFFYTVSLFLTHHVCVIIRLDDVIGVVHCSHSFKSAEWIAMDSAHSHWEAQCTVGCCSWSGVTVVSQSGSPGYRFQITWGGSATRSWVWVQQDSVHQVKTFVKTGLLWHGNGSGLKECYGMGVQSEIHWKHSHQPIHSQLTDTCNLAVALRL